MSIISKAFVSLTAGGRATAMQEPAVRMLRDSIVSMAEGAHDFIRAILGDIGFGVMREDAIIQWEKTFNLSPDASRTLAQRQGDIESAWALDGAQGAGYLQAKLQSAGFDIRIVENIPVQDLSPSNGITFNATGGFTFGDNLGPEGFSAPMFGEGRDGYLLGNGRLSNNSGYTFDPIETPQSTSGTSAPTLSSTTLPGISFGDLTFGDAINRWGYVFTIEGQDGARANIPSQRRESFETLIVRLKPMHLGVILKVNYV